MKKVLIIEASPRKGFCSQTVQTIVDRLQDQAEMEILNLREADLTLCKGCALCLSTGSRFCPAKDDDAQKILAKMLQTDGVIYVVPNYALQVPGILKILFDRLAYVFHRPRLFGKVSLPIVVQGVYGGGKIAKYVNEVMEFWGMNPAPGAVVIGGVYPKEAQNEKIFLKNRQAIDKALDGFIKIMNNQKSKQPSFFKVMIFRSTRTAMHYSQEVLAPDRKYYQENGWFDSPYFYPVRLNPAKQLAGWLMDRLMKNMTTKQS